MSRTIAVVTALLVLSPAPVRAGTWLIPPVDAVVSRRFEAPGTLWGPGHRGIDYEIAANSPIRAAGDGRVLFAGPVAGDAAITIAHEDGLETTYSDLSEVFVRAGDVVEQGY